MIADLLIKSVSAQEHTITGMETCFSIKLMCFSEIMTTDLLRFKSVPKSLIMGVRDTHVPNIQCIYDNIIGTSSLNEVRNTPRNTIYHIPRSVNIISH